MADHGLHNHFLVLRLWCMIQTNWRPVSTSRKPNAPNSQLQIILELIWNKQQFESDDAFQNLTYWKVLRICKLNVLIQNLTTCVSLKQNSHKFQVSTLCHTLIHWQEAQEWHSHKKSIPAIFYCSDARLPKTSAAFQHTFCPVWGTYTTLNSSLALAIATTITMISESNKAFFEQIQYKW